VYSNFKAKINQLIVEQNIMFQKNVTLAKIKNSPKAFYNNTAISAAIRKSV